jgi:hypothetical protein
LDLASFSSCTCTTRQITWCTWSLGYDHVMQLDSFSFLFLFRFLLSHFQTQF